MTNLEHLEGEPLTDEELAIYAKYSLSCSFDRLLVTIREQRKELEALRTFANEVDEIRNSIIKHQTINWSAHIYPLVAALKKIGRDYSRPSKESLQGLVNASDR